MRKLNNNLMSQIISLLDLETVINLYKAELISEKCLLVKLGYRDVLEMHMAHQKEIEHIHNMYLCSTCKSDRDITYCIDCDLPVCVRCGACIE